MKLSLVVISQSGKLTDAFLRTCDFADEVVLVLNTGTKASRKYPSKLKILRHDLNGDFASHRNFALENCRGEWVLFVDDDEYVSTALSQEILTKISNQDYAGFVLPRTDVVYDKTLKYGETGKIKILRLGRKNAGKFVRKVHEIWQIRGRVGEITSPLYHQKDHFISEFFGRMTYYSPIDAISLQSEGKSFSYFRLFANPLLKFIQNYFLRLGFLDGTPGLFLSYLMSVQSLTVRIFQWLNQK